MLQNKKVEKTETYCQANASNSWNATDKGRANVKTRGNKYIKAKARAIKTDLMEILQALTSQTEDDSKVMESLANILSSYRVRFGQTLAPLRITSGKPGRALRRANLGRRNPAWA